MTIRRTAITLVLIAAGLWSAACVLLHIKRTELIYPFRTGQDAGNAAGIPGISVQRITAQDGVPLVVWTAPRRAGRPVVVHFIGNAGALHAAGPRLSELVHQGFGVVALNYRGAGLQPGVPGREAILSDALAVYDRLADLAGLTPNEAPVLYGTSLGAAVAVQVAARRPVQALVLETPFASLCETARHHFPIFPACLILYGENWDSAKAIARISAPLLILHGDADQIIPQAHGAALYQGANQPKQMITYPGGRHNDLRLFGSGIDIVAFLDALPTPR